MVKEFVFFFPVEYSGMFSLLGTVITPYTYIIITWKYLLQFLELVFKPFLGPENVKIIKPDQSGYGMHPVWPGIQRITRSVIPEVVSGYAQVLCFCA